MWFPVICERLWNWFGVILGDSQWFSNHSEISLLNSLLFGNYSDISFGRFLVILGDSHCFTDLSQITLGKFLLLHKPLWNVFEVIPKGLMVFGWFYVILIDFWKTLKLVWGDSWWFSVIIKPFWKFFGLILSNSHWFSVILGWFLMILDVYQWFVNNYKIALGWFSVIHKISEISLVLFIIILYDSSGFKTTLKFILGNSWWIWLFTNHSEITLGWFLLIPSDYQWFMFNFFE